jgi:hypothetical protein
MCVVVFPLVAYTLQDGCTAFSAAAASGRTDCVRLLVEHGADQSTAANVRPPRRNLRPIIKKNVNIEVNWRSLHDEILHDEIHHFGNACILTSSVSGGSRATVS